MKQFKFCVKKIFLKVFCWKTVPTLQNEVLDLEYHMVFVLFSVFFMQNHSKNMKSSIPFGSSSKNKMN